MKSNAAFSNPCLTLNQGLLNPSFYSCIVYNNIYIYNTGIIKGEYEGGTMGCASLAHAHTRAHTRGGQS